MKNLLLFTFLICTTFFLKAQPQVNYSEAFEELPGSDHLLLMKSGATVYVDASEDGINVRIYNAEHKQVAQANTSNDIWTDRKFSAAEFKGLHDIAGQAVLFMSQLNRGNVLTLHRLIIDPATAKVTKADLVATIPTRRGSGYDLSALVTNDYYIEVDPVTNNYAVLLFEGYTAAKADRVKLQTFNPGHQMLKEAVVEYKVNTGYIHYDGMCMYNNTVYLGTNRYESKEENVPIPLILSVLGENDKTFESHELKIKPFNLKSRCQLLYNQGKNLLQLLVATETASDMKGRFGGYTTITKYYSSLIAYLNPKDLNAVAYAPYSKLKADEYAKRKLGEAEGFNGVIPVMALNNDNTTALLASEQYSSQYGNSGANYIDKLGIIYLDTACKEKAAYVMRVPVVSGSAYTRSIVDGFNTPYISTPSGDYIIMNDLSENFDKPETETPHKLSTISDANTILCKLQDGKIKKSYLFGAPANKKQAKFSFPGNAIYDNVSHTYITLMIENNNGKKEQHIAWVKFE